MHENTEPRNERHTLMLTQSEVNDARLVAGFHNKGVGEILRDWALGDVRAEASRIRSLAANAA
jgi:hypothetical protein